MQGTQRFWEVTIALPGLNLRRYIASASRPTHEQVEAVWAKESKTVLRPSGWKGPLADAYPGVGGIEEIQIHGIATAEPDWRKDPSADERWNAGLDYGQKQLCAVLGVDPETVRWDAATETLDGDVRSAIGNVLTAWAGDNWRDVAKDGAERCVACDLPLVDGDVVLQEESGGTIHLACCGPDRDSYTKGDGEPLGPDDPIPEGYVYETSKGA